MIHCLVNEFTLRIYDDFDTIIIPFRILYDNRQVRRLYRALSRCIDDGLSNFVVWCRDSSPITTSMFDDLRNAVDSHVPISSHTIQIIANPTGYTYLTKGTVQLAIAPQSHRRRVGEYLWFMSLVGSDGTGYAASITSDRDFAILEDSISTSGGLDSCYMVHESLHTVSTIRRLSEGSVLA